MGSPTVIWDDEQTAKTPAASTAPEVKWDDEPTPGVLPAGVTPEMTSSHGAPAAHPAPVVAPPAQTVTSAPPQNAGRLPGTVPQPPAPVAAQRPQEQAAAAPPPQAAPPSFAQQTGWKPPVKFQTPSTDNPVSRLVKGAGEVSHTIGEETQIQPGARMLADYIQGTVDSMDPDATNHPALARAYKTAIGPLGKGAVKYAAAMTDPETAAMIVAFQGVPTSTLPGAAFHSAIGAYFAGKMGIAGLTGAYQSYKEANQGNIPLAVETGLGAFFNLAMAGAGAKATAELADPGVKFANSPEAKGVYASLFGGKVAAAGVVTPEGVKVGGRVGDVQAKVEIPREPKPAEEARPARPAVANLAERNPEQPIEGKPVTTPEVKWDDEPIQPSNDTAENIEAAKQAQPELIKQAENIAAKVTGADVVDPDTKAPEHVARKVETGDKPEEITDYARGTITAPTPEAAAQVNQEVAQTLPVEKSEPLTSNGIEDTTKHIVDVDGHKAELQVTTEAQREAMDQTHDLYDQQKKAMAEGDTALAEKIGEQITAIHEAAQQKVLRRTSDSTLGSVQAPRSTQEPVSSQAPAAGPQSSPESPAMAPEQGAGDKSTHTAGNPSAELQARAMRDDITREELGAHPELGNYLSPSKKTELTQVAGGARSAAAAGEAQAPAGVSQPVSAQTGSTPISKGDTATLNGKPVQVEFPGAPAVNGGKAAPARVILPGGKKLLVDPAKLTKVESGHVDTGAIGDPIPERVEQIKQELAKGTDVRIFTARVANDPQGEVRAEIEQWSEKQFGRKLPITNAKDDNLAFILDDKANIAPNANEPFQIPQIPKGKWLGVDLDRTLAVEKPQAGEPTGAVAQGEPAPAKPKTWKDVAKKPATENPINSYDAKQETNRDKVNGLKVGDMVTFTKVAPGSYLRPNEPYRVDSVSKDSVGFKNPKTGGGTSDNKRMLALAEFTSSTPVPAPKVETPAAKPDAKVQTIAGKMDLDEFEKKGYAPEQ